MNTLHMRLFVGGQDRNLITLMDLPGLDLSLKTAEGMIRTADSLHRQIKALFCIIFLNIYVFQVLQ